MAKKTDSNGLANEITKILEAYENVTLQEMEEAVAEVTKETVRMLKRTSPKNTGAYAKSWTSKNVKSGNRLGAAKVVYNKKYRLTHLLEKGHKKVNGKGRVPGIPHIAPAEAEAEKMLMEILERRL